MPEEVAKADVLEAYDVQVEGEVGHETQGSLDYKAMAIKLMWHGQSSHQ
jgi:hypothetical protein